ncbi:protealysin inhibitor emfourin [Pseudoduganella sp. RAF53_2]|uniref:protealysin inhibitor emfourin n=1 Tax=unclassified Pseudoduganella TaxID=2637179 RepID=UPI003F9B8EF9
MKIMVTGGGGFAGLSQHYEVDTQTSPAGPALEAALASNDFFEAPDPPGTIGADIPRWTITAIGDGRQRSLSFAEDAPSPWLDLLNLIRAAA